MVRKVPVHDDFSADHLAALGHFILAFGRVEYMVKLTVKSLSGQGFTKGMASAESKGQFGKLCVYGKKLAITKLSSEQCDAYRALLKEAEALAIERNDNVHCLWTTEHDAPIRYRPFYNRTKKDLEWRSRRVSADALDQLRANLDKLFHDLDKERKSWSVSAQSGSDK